MNESLESIKLIQQLFVLLFMLTLKMLINFYFREYIMESMIYCFNLTYLLLKLFIYVRQEGPKGELGLIICTNNIELIYRLKIRSPD
jgi:NADH:ubiquinone oxidoreductase subunit D